MDDKSLFLGMAIHLVVGILVGALGWGLVYGLKQLCPGKTVRLTVGSISGGLFSTAIGIAAEVIFANMLRREPHMALTVGITLPLGCLAGFVETRFPGLVGDGIAGLIFGAVAGNGYTITTILGGIGGFAAGIFLSHAASGEEKRDDSPSKNPDRGKSIRFLCSRCKKKLIVRKELIGKKVRCPGCRMINRISNRADLIFCK